MVWMKAAIQKIISRDSHKDRKLIPLGTVSKSRNLERKPSNATARDKNFGKQRSLECKVRELDEELYLTKWKKIHLSAGLCSEVLEAVGGRLHPFLLSLPRTILWPHCGELPGFYAFENSKSSSLCIYLEDSKGPREGKSYSPGIQSKQSSEIKKKEEI